jgi:hypothetical protein
MLIVCELFVFSLINRFGGHRQPGNIVKVKVIGHWIEQSGNRKSDETDLDSFGKIEEFPEGWHKGGALPNERHVLDATDEQDEKQDEAGDA